MEKVNTQKFPTALEDKALKIAVYETVEEAAVEAVRQAGEANVMPSSIMVTAQDGYATGDGEVHRALGVTSGKPGTLGEVAESAPVAEEEVTAPEKPVTARKASKAPVTEVAPEVSAESPTAATEATE